MRNWAQDLQDNELMWDLCNTFLLFWLTFYATPFILRMGLQALIIQTWLVCSHHMWFWTQLCWDLIVWTILGFCEHRFLHLSNKPSTNSNLCSSKLYCHPRSSHCELQGHVVLVKLRAAASLGKLMWTYSIYLLVICHVWAFSKHIEVE